MSEGRTKLTSHVWFSNFIMKRLILNIDDNMTEEAALWYALQVAKGGKVSETSKGKQFCLHTVFGGSRHVSVTKSKTGTETFNIWKKENK